eukprot:TRINITY_DN8450_c0_g1_i1.p3 TRINITY_DN8450_c0_g1~~TRINITY_DN8450_c0_g1_i1.p3  ORF type:complete len:103 (-),score=21.67 TRINITY_DN8450_c0_g1_i1:170-478(-)
MRARVAAVFLVAAFAGALRVGDDDSVVAAAPQKPALHVPGTSADKAVYKAKDTQENSVKSTAEADAEWGHGHGHGHGFGWRGHGDGVGYGWGGGHGGGGGHR